jgi:hypothetical protein
MCVLPHDRCQESKFNSRVVQRRALTICFTICLCVSLDLDGYRAPKNGCFTVVRDTIQKD